MLRYYSLDLCLKNSYLLGSILSMFVYVIIAMLKSMLPIFMLVLFAVSCFLVYLCSIACIASLSFVVLFLYEVMFSYPILIGPRVFSLFPSSKSIDFVNVSSLFYIIALYYNMAVEYTVMPSIRQVKSF